MRALAVVLAALALAGPAAAACAHPKTSLTYLEGQVMCPTCHTTLDQSDSAAARQIEGFIRGKVAKCWTAHRIETALVANYGQGILAAPSHKGFDLLAWWLPIVGVLAGAIVLAIGVWRWSRRREPEPPEPPGSGFTGEEVTGGTDLSFPGLDLSEAELVPLPSCAEAHPVISSRVPARAACRITCFTSHPPTTGRTGGAPRSPDGTGTPRDASGGGYRVM